MSVNVKEELSIHPLTLAIGSPAEALRATVQCSVIQGPPRLLQNADHASAFKPVSPSDSTSSVLPTCTNSNLNSNWIAMKFGAAVGPNRMSYPREFKLMVIDYYYRNGQNKYRTCKEFQITKSMLNGWLQKIDKIRQSRPGSLKSGRSGRRPQFPNIEKQLFALYQAHIATGQKIGNRWIRETARNLAKQQCSSEELGGMCQFSERWLSNFKKRYHINLNKDWTPTTSTGGSVGESCASSTVSGTTLDSPVSSNNEEKEATLMVRDEGEEISTTDETPMITTAIKVEPTELNSDSKSPLKEEQLNNSSIFPNFPDLQLTQGLPIHEFYRQFPWLYKRGTVSQSSYEPGRRGRKVQFPQVEKVLYERLLERQSGGHRVSNRWLQEQARSLAMQLCPEVLAEATKSARCMFSEHWLHNFKKRYGVSIKHQKINNPTSALPSPPTTVVRQNNHIDNLVLNDETALQSPPNDAQLLMDTTPLNSGLVAGNNMIGNGDSSNNGPLEPAAIAAFVQMQQLLLQQYCLQTLAMSQLQTAAAANAMPTTTAPFVLNAAMPNTTPTLLDFYRRLAEQQPKQPANISSIGEDH